MKVKELIAKLQNCDPEMKVVVELKDFYTKIVEAKNVSAIEIIELYHGRNEHKEYCGEDEEKLEEDGYTLGKVIIIRR